MMLPLLQAPAPLVSPAEAAAIQLDLVAQGQSAVHRSNYSTFQCITSSMASRGSHSPGAGGAQQTNVAKAPNMVVIPVSAQSSQLSMICLLQAMDSAACQSRNLAISSPPSSDSVAGAADGSPPCVKLAIVDGASVAQLVLLSGLQPPSES